MKNKVLVIEDNQNEALFARMQLSSAGFKVFKVVSNLSYALEELPNYDLVLSDLFFPAGEIDATPYISRFLPHYESFKQRRFKDIAGDNIVLKAVHAAAELVGATPEEYVNNWMPRMNSPPKLMTVAKDALKGKEDSQRYEEYLLIESAVREGTKLPLGIVASERAQELGKKVVIVTSTYHHDDSFEAVNNLIKVGYVDTLVDGKKNWKGGIELLLK